VDLLTAVASLAAAAGTGTGGYWYRRARRAETHATFLHHELATERHAASHDPLTGLFNRRALYQLGATLVPDCDGPPVIVVVLDLDDFKLINDVYGHQVGDQVLVATARRFAGYAGHDLVARLGGDEFAGLLRSATHPHLLRQQAYRLAEILAAPIPLANGSIAVTASVGMATVAGCADLHEALRRADTAMYLAKAGPRPSGHDHHGATDPIVPLGYPYAAVTGRTITMPVPTLDPDQRDPADIAPTNSYRPADPVWIHRAGAWYPGIVEAASPGAAMVTYRPIDSRGTYVDTLTAANLIARTDIDPVLDQHQPTSTLNRRDQSL